MIIGKTIALRPLDRRHSERTRGWANDPRLAQFLDRAWPVGDAEHEEWFSSLSKNKDHLYLAIETLESEKHVGNIWLWGIDWRHRKAELRIVIGETDCGRGIGSEAIGLLCSHGFERLNLHKIYAYVLGANPRARCAFEKAGFSIEGTLKEDRWVGDCYSDVYLLANIANPPKD
jgi:RimJ/RimL family protein N-acetyltransferase